MRCEHRKRFTCAMTTRSAHPVSRPILLNVPSDNTTRSSGVYFKKVSRIPSLGSTALRNRIELHSGCARSARVKSPVPAAILTVIGDAFRVVPTSLTRRCSRDPTRMLRRGAITRRAGTKGGLYSCVAERDVGEGVLMRTGCTVHLTLRRNRSVRMHALVLIP